MPLHRLRINTYCSIFIKNVRIEKGNRCECIAMQVQESGRGVCLTYTGWQHLELGGQTFAGCSRKWHKYSEVSIEKIYTVACASFGHFARKGPGGCAEPLENNRASQKRICAPLFRKFKSIFEIGAEVSSVPSDCGAFSSHCGSTTLEKETLT